MRIWVRTVSNQGIAILIVLALAALPVGATDVLRPADVEGLAVDRDQNDLVVSWTPVTEDIGGFTETVSSYRIYRGTGSIWPDDFAEIGTTTSTSFTDVGVAGHGIPHRYLVAAVDADGNTGQPRPATIDVPPTLSLAPTRFTINLSWTAAEPAVDVTAYRIYFGTAPGAYTEIRDVGLALSHVLTETDIVADTQYFIAVAAIDLNGNESIFSEEKYEAMFGTVKVRAHNESHICFGGCPPVGNEISHDSGREIVVPITFPVVDDWVRVTLTYTVESRLCDDVPDICGGNNPGWNPCGDPWDRTAGVTLVLDDCVQTGSRCYGSSGNIELLHAVTPFGTDADPPDGNGDVGPRVWNFDITPYAPLLTGTKHIGAFIAVWVSPGWYATVDFEFTKVPLLASPKPPAAGIIPVSFRDGGNVSGPTSVTIPASATQVMGRLFTTGHGGNTDPEVCECGAGAPCDEFCQKTVEVIVDGVPVWSTVPWRTDCSPAGDPCLNWNACGFPSCTFSRSGWCPGYIACHHNAPCDQDLDLTNWLAPGGTYDVMVNVPAMTPGAAWANSLAVYWYE